MTLQLYVWGPALDAPSIDPSCVALEAYLRVTNANFTVVYANDPQLSPTGKAHNHPCNLFALNNELTTAIL